MKRYLTQFANYSFIQESSPEFGYQLLVEANDENTFIEKIQRLEKNAVLINNKLLIDLLVEKGRAAANKVNPTISAVYNKLADNHKINLASHVTSTKNLPIFTVVAADANKLFSIVVNIDKISVEPGNYITKLAILTNELNEQERKFKNMNFTYEQKLAFEKEKLAKQESLAQSIVNDINIIDFVMAVYYGYIQFIVRGIEQMKDPMLRDFAGDYFINLIMKLFAKRYTIGGLPPMQLNIFKAACYYCFIKQFSNFSNEDIAKEINIKYGIEASNAIFSTDYRKILGISNLPTLLSFLKLINVSPAIFTAELIKNIGKDSYICLITTYDIFIAHAIITKYPNKFFLAPVINIDIQNSIEKKVLDYARQIIL